MDQQHRTWAIRAGVGGAVCALLTAWMIPNTTPTNRPSVIAGMAGTAEAQKPTYSAVPDAAIPSWAASLKQVPGDSPPAGAPPAQIADAGPLPEVDPADTSPGPEDAPTPDQTPPPLATAEAAPPAAAPAPPDGYQTRRDAWQARLDTVMQGQQGPS